jgi:ZIP family zinc transporter
MQVRNCREADPAGGQGVAEALRIRVSAVRSTSRGALLRGGLSSGLTVAYPVGLGLAAGAMLFVVAHQVIPETRRNGDQTFATRGLMLGIALMMVLDTALG